MSDVICFANEWSGDPLSKKHVMLELAREHRVIWINSINNRQPRIASKDFRRSAEKLRGFFRGLQHVQANIWVLTPIFVPLHGSSIARWINRVLLRTQIRRALRRLRFTDPITWTFMPTSADVVGQLGEEFVLYHCVDEYAAFSDASGAVRDRENDLLTRSNLVVVSAAALLESKRQINPRTYLVTHGVDYDHFRRAVDPATPLAPELAAIPRPILGFHGLIADWVDLPVMAEIARRRPDWSIVLIGKVDTDLSALSGLANVHLVPRQPFKRLPEFLKGFDIAILPFVQNELTVNANPLKLREYIAAGLPVISAPLPEVRRLQESVYLATTADEYIAIAAKILATGDTGPSSTRSLAMQNESWHNKVQEITALIATTFPDSKAARLHTSAQTMISSEMHQSR